MLALRLAFARDAGCVQTDFCHPTHSTTSTRASWVPGAVSGEFIPCADLGDLAFHDALSASAGLPAFFHGGRLSSHVSMSRSAVPLTSLSLFHSPDAVRQSHRLCETAGDSVYRVSVTCTRYPQPGMPSVDGESLTRFPAAIPRRCRDFAIAARWNDAGSLTAVSPALSRRRLATIR